MVTVFHDVKTCNKHIISCRKPTAQDLLQKWWRILSLLTKVANRGLLGAEPRKANTKLRSTPLIIITMKQNHVAITCESRVNGKGEYVVSTTFHNCNNLKSWNTRVIL